MMSGCARIVCNFHLLSLSCTTHSNHSDHVSAPFLYLIIIIRVVLHNRFKHNRHFSNIEAQHKAMRKRSTKILAPLGLTLINCSNTGEYLPPNQHCCTNLDI